MRDCKLFPFEHKSFTTKSNIVVSKLLNLEMTSVYCLFSKKISEGSFACNPTGKQNDNLFTCLNRYHLLLWIFYEILLKLSSIACDNEKGSPFVLSFWLLQLGWDVGRKFWFLTWQQRSLLYKLCDKSLANICSLIPKFTSQIHQCDTLLIPNHIKIDMQTCSAK